MNLMWYWKRSKFDKRYSLDIIYKLDYSKNNCNKCCAECNFCI